MVDRETYRNRWRDHIEELTRLGWYLEEADRDRIAELQGELWAIVDVAAENKVREENDLERIQHVD